MVKVDTNGQFIATIEFRDGAEWISTVRSLIRVVQGMDEHFMNRDEVYDALTVVDNLLPDDETAAQLWRAYRKEHAEPEA